MGKISYLKKWEEKRPWLREVRGDISKAHCCLCKKDFLIDKCGVAQVNTHANGISHKTKEINAKNQCTFTSSNGKVLACTSNKLIFSKEELVIKAETLNGQLNNRHFSR